VELYLNSPSTPSWRGAQLKRRDNFTFTFIISRMKRQQGSSETLAPSHIITRCHNPKDNDLKHHRRESLKTLIKVFYILLGQYVVVQEKKNLTE
jgi:hypothetical protein